MSWLERNQEEGEENEAQEDEEDEFKSVNDRIIFLIDAREDMLINNKQDNEYQLRNCLKVALSVMKTKIVAQDSSSIGITFFGTREKDGNESTDGIFTLFSLAPITAQRIRQLQGLLDDKDEFSRTIGSQRLDKASVPLKQVLWTCSQSFASKDYKKTDFKRIWIFTNDDNPNSNFPREQEATITVARDCSQAGIEISLWHLNNYRNNHIFNPKTFYFKLLIAGGNISGEDDVESSIDQRMLSGGFDGFDALLASVRRKEYRKRRLASLLFSFGETDVKQTSDNPLLSQDSGKTNLMAVQLYKLVNVAKKPLHTWLHSRSNEPLKSISRMYNEHTGETLEGEQIETFLDVGGRRVAFQKSEMDSIKLLQGATFVKEEEKPLVDQQASIRLLYFTNKDRIAVDYNTEAPYFLYPDEKTIKGSALIFEALLREMAKASVVALVAFKRSKASVPRFAVLWPQLEVVDEDGCQTVPPGLHLLPLPFAEELRYNPLDVAGKEDTVVGEEAISAAKQVIDAMSLEGADGDAFEYHRVIENPALQQFYSVLQAVALNERALEWKADEHDTLVPPRAALEKADGAVAVFKVAVGLDDADVEAAAPKKKRAADQSSGGAAKRAKPKASDDAADDQISEQSVLDLARASQLSGFTVAKLKEMCKIVGVPVSGTKQELINRITAKA